VLPDGNANASLETPLETDGSFAWIADSKNRTMPAHTENPAKGTWIGSITGIADLLRWR
jgi:hypothetical protein